MPTDIIGNYVKDIPFGQFSVHGLLQRFHLEPVPALPVLLVMVVPYLVWLWWSRALPFTYLAIGTAAWYFIADLFLPDYRGLYDDVFIINVLAAGVVTAKEIPWAAWPCLLACRSAGPFTPAKSTARG